MRFLIAVAAAVLISASADAQCISTWSKDCDDSRGSSTYGDGYGRSSGYDVNRGPDDRGDRVSPYSPNRPSDSYRQEPTLGDPRNTRQTDPRRCTGLLCD